MYLTSACLCGLPLEGRKGGEGESGSRGELTEQGTLRGEAEVGGEGGRRSHEPGPRDSRGERIKQGSGGEACFVLRFDVGRHRVGCGVQILILSAGAGCRGRLPRTGGVGTLRAW